MNYVTLVNKKNQVKDKYFKYLELVDYKTNLNDVVKIEKNTLGAYLKLKQFLESKNIYIEINSAYRSLEEQQKIIDEYTLKYGKEYVDNFVAPVGASEHHTGLAVDLCLKVNDKFIIENDDLFSCDNIFLNLHKYLHEFGFILRYPRKKEDVTGYNYEPWHIRYVGEVVASIIYNNNLTLEEYLSSFSGVLVVNKEKDMTSRDVVNEVSRVLGIKKIGHTGTLDPMAQGVLVLTIGKATKIGELLTSSEKEYIALVEIGLDTDSLDITGKILNKKEPKENIDYEKLCKSFQKKYLQEVPIYSAVKVNGKKLYQYAREDKEVVLPKKEVDIKKIDFISSCNNTFKFKTLVSKGTYIRSLIRDMGNSIDEYFCMKSLVRTKQGDFSINCAYTLDDIKNNKFKIISIKDALSKYKTINLEDKEIIKKISNGVRINNIYNIKDICLFTVNDNLIAIYKASENKLVPWKVFN